jgi:urease accessory protein
MRRASRLRAERSPTPSDVVVLDFDARQKHRFLAKLEGGGELAVHLPRGSVLAGGDVLETEDGGAVLVREASEPLSVARVRDPLQLARVAYHLGNRHVALQIEPGRVSYRHDHVLDDLAARLGAEVSFERGPFSPEGGAYGRGALHGHSHHQHEHHEHEHHEHEHEHDGTERAEREP